MHAKDRAQTLVEFGDTTVDVDHASSFSDGHANRLAHFVQFRRLDWRASAHPDPEHVAERKKERVTQFPLRSENGHLEVPVRLQICRTDSDQKLWIMPTPNNLGSAPTLAGLSPG